MDDDIALKITRSNRWLIAIVLIAAFGFPIAAIGQTDYCDASGACESFFQRFLKQKPNEIGDTLAGLFSPLAFAVAMVALLLQSRELRLSREQTTKTAEALTIQSNLLVSQQADSEIEEWMLTLKSHLSNDLNKLSNIVWVFEPLPFGKLGAQGSEIQHSLEYYPELEDDPESYLKRVESVLSDFVHGLSFLKEQCKGIRFPDAHYKADLSELVGKRIELASRRASPAMKQKLRNQRIPNLVHTLEELNTGPWWYEAGLIR